MPDESPFVISSYSTSQQQQKHNGTGIKSDMQANELQQKIQIYTYTAIATYSLIKNQKIF